MYPCTVLYRRVVVVVVVIREHAPSRATAETTHDLMAIACRGRHQCDTLVERAMRPHEQAFARPKHGCACNLSATADALHNRWHSSATAAADLFWQNCNTTPDKLAASAVQAAHKRRGKEPTLADRFCRDDAKGYFNLTWLPDAPRGGWRCRSITRYGPPLGSDGGKMLCETDTLLRDSSPCLIVSVGLRGDTRFEQELHAASPHCEIVGMDGTLSLEHTAMVPKFLRFVPRNFNATSYTEFSRRNVRLLKMDCDRCEYQALRPWIDHVCTEQIVIEIHRETFSHPLLNAYNHHSLVSAMHDRGYRMAFLEPNPIWPKLGTEYTWVRNSTCDGVATWTSGPVHGLVNP